VEGFILPIQRECGGDPVLVADLRKGARDLESGSGVLHSRCLRLAEKNGLPLHVLSFYDPDLRRHLGPGLALPRGCADAPAFLRENMDRWDEHFQISTVFDQDPDSPHGILYSSSIRNTLMRLLPPGVLLFEGPQEAFLEEFSVFCRLSGGGMGKCQNFHLSALPSSANGVKFFYE